MSGDAGAWYGLVVVEPLSGYQGTVPEGASQAFVHVGAAAPDEAAFRERIEGSARRRGLAVVEFDTVENGTAHEFQDAEIEREWQAGVASGAVLWDTTYRWF